jgi:hypothetical protein
VSSPQNGLPEYVAAEYAATQSAYLQYDSFRWQSGGLLIAGSFVFLGFLTSKDITSTSLFVGSLVVTVVMSIWMLYAQHYRQLYLYKIDRLLELEHEMGAEQHRRFNVGQGAAKEYPRIGVRGHYLDGCVYAFISFGGPLLAIFGGKWSLLLILPIILVPLVLITVRRQDRQTIKWLTAHRGADN